MFLNYNFHTHTYRCGHAYGKDLDYVRTAIDCGYKVLGFSDHIMFEGYSQPGTRGEYSQLNGYINSINKLKEVFKNQIEIHVGAEAEYIPIFLDYYKELKESGKIEYLILGQHCFINENKEFEWYLGKDNQCERVNRYVEDLIKGMSTGLFSYVAHPDIFVRMFKEFNPIIEEAAIKIGEASLKYNVPLELNLSGTRPWTLKEENLHCPNDRFWKIIGKMGVKTVIGVDAHDPNDFLVSNYEYIFKFIEENQINFIVEFNI